MGRLVSCEYCAGGTSVATLARVRPCGATLMPGGARCELGFRRRSESRGHGRAGRSAVVRVPCVRPRRHRPRAGHRAEAHRGAVTDALLPQVRVDRCAPRAFPEVKPVSGIEQLV